MSVKYLCDIFQEAIIGMATGTGSIQQRLRGAQQGCLYKISDKDIENIPNEAKEDFVELRKILPGKINEIENELKEEVARLSPSDFNKINPDRRWVYKRLHWKTAKKAAELIGKIYIYLHYELDEKQ